MSTSILNATFPTPETPFLAETGTVSQPWFYLLLSLFARTGGKTPTSPAILQEQIDSLFVEEAMNDLPFIPTNGGTPFAITIGSSPFVFTAPAPGQLLISGGGVSRLRFSRDHTQWFSTGSFYGEFSLLAGDALEISYVVAPVATFVPAS